ncbi:MAG: hypothetical protein QMD04_07720, partial [Anaerolineales bacterium]|nr:hypothetical protein [Anaerolineales bacterium]
RLVLRAPDDNLCVHPSAGTGRNEKGLSTKIAKFYAAEGLPGRVLINKGICSILMTRSRTIVKE